MCKQPLSIILSVILLFSCNTKNIQETVLKIGQYKLTAPDLEAKRKNEKYRSLTDQDFQDKLIEEGRILAFALDRRFDTISALNKLLEYASRSYASRVDGFVWNKKEKPKLQLTEKDLRNAYVKRDRELTIEVIQAQGKNLLDKCYKSDKDFDILKKRASIAGDFKVFTMPSRFPYSPLSIYIPSVEIAKAGDVLGPVETEEGYVVARVAAIKPLRQNSYEKEKESIEKDMVSMLTRKYMWESEKQISSKANTEINDSAIRELTSKFNAIEKSWPGVNPKLTVMNYTLEGKRLSYTVSDFEEFVKNEPVFFGSLSKPEDVKKMLHYFISEKYLFAEAQKMNIQADKGYQQFRKDYQQRIFLEYYKRNYIYPKIVINPIELHDYYRNHNGDFRAFESATVLIYKFKDFQKAFQARMLLSRKLQGLALTEKNNVESNTLPLPNATVMELKINDPGNDPKFVEAVLALQPGQVSSPVEFNGDYLLISPSVKTGISTIPFNFIKEHIKQVLHAQKETQLYAQAAKELKVKYPEEKNTISKYLSGIRDKQPEQR